MYYKWHFQTEKTSSSEKLWKEQKYNITKYKIIFKKIISQFKKLIELFNKELLFNNSGEVYENDIKNIIKNDIKSKIIKISDIEAEFLQYSNF